MCVVRGSLVICWDRDSWICWVWMSHMPHISESHHTYWCGTSLVIHICGSWLAHHYDVRDVFIRGIWKRHVPRIIESQHMYRWVTCHNYSYVWFVARLSYTEGVTHWYVEFHWVMCCTSASLIAHINASRRVPIRMCGSWLADHILRMSVWTLNESCAASQQRCSTDTHVSRHTTIHMCGSWLACHVWSSWLICMRHVRLNRTCKHRQYTRNASSVCVYTHTHTNTHTYTRTHKHSVVYMRTRMHTLNSIYIASTYIMLPARVSN